MDNQNKYYNMMVDEINTITEEDVREFAFKLLNAVPDYFFTVPASSSGKYHPVNDLGEGGLVRHSISVKRMLCHLLEPDGYYDFTDRQKDLLKVAALFHDCLKSGSSTDYEANIHTKHLHPLYACNFIMGQAVLNDFNYDDTMFITNAVISHMGQWNKSTREKGTLPIPKTPEQKLLHLADYLSSRKDINMVFEEEETANTNEVAEEKKESV